MIRGWKPVERYEDFKLMKAILSNIIVAKWKTETLIMNIFHFDFIFSFIKSCAFVARKDLVEKYLTRPISVIRIDLLLVLQFSCKCWVAFFPFWICQQNTQTQYFP